MVVLMLVLLTRRRRRRTGGDYDGHDDDVALIVVSGLMVVATLVAASKTCGNKPLVRFVRTYQQSSCCRRDEDIVGSLELTFLVVFCVEMAVLLTALGLHCCLLHAVKYNCRSVCHVFRPAQVRRSDLL